MLYYNGDNSNDLSKIVTVELEKKKEKHNGHRHQEKVYILWGNTQVLLKD